MRIREVSVSGLFGTFDHVIPLNLEDRITIVHGPNGFGKTVILRMLEDLMKLRWAVFWTTPFSKFRVTFDNSAVLEIVRRPSNRTSRKRNKEPFSLKLRLEVPDSEPKETEIAHRSANISPPAEQYLSAYLSRIGPGQWVVDETREVIGNEEVIERYANVLPAGTFHPRNADYPWAADFVSKINVLFIKTQRLHDPGPRVTMERFRRPQHYAFVDPEMDQRDAPAVTRHSDEIKREIQATLSTYASRSQELDSSFPTRLFQQARTASLQLEDLRSRLAQLEDRRTALTKLGFLTPEPDSKRTIPKIDEEKRDALSVYVLDNEQKLAVFDSMASKIRLFTETINRRFQYKKISISKDKGFVFTSLVDGSELSPASLSSGEQHEVVLLYELLFKVSQKSIILIDEPEISLHLAWQQQFTVDLQEMVALSGFDVLIATHSPAIIGRRIDLAVELKGPTIRQESSDSI